MRKRSKVVVSVILVFAVIAAVYYFTPKTFGKGVNPSSVDHINVFDGNTGRGFTVDNAEDVKYIVENIQSKPMRRSGISLGRMGYRFSVEFVDQNDRAIIPIFIINGDHTIRKDPFFYHSDGELCSDYLTELENKMVSDEE